MKLGQRLSSLLDAISLWHVLLAGFVVRLAWAAAVPMRPISDGSVYDRLARSIANGIGYVAPDGTPTAYWPVGTSAFYGSLYAVFGTDPIVATLANVVLGTLLIGATFWLACTRFDERVAKLAAIFTAVWPTWIALTTIMSSELASTLFLAAGLAVLLSGRGQDWLRTVLATGLFVIAAYFRANYLPIALMLPALTALSRRSAPYFIKQALLSGLTAAVLLAPWMIRNHRAFAEVVPISTNFGVNLWIGSNPDAHGGYMEPPPIGEGQSAGNEVQQDKAYRNHAMAYIAANPGHYALLCGKRIIQTFDRETYGVSWNADGLPDATEAPLKIVMTSYWLAIFVTAGIGLLLFISRSWINLFDPLIIASGMVSATSILVLAADRFHYGLAPIIACFAAYALLGRANTAADDRTKVAAR